MTQYYTNSLHNGLETQCLLSTKSSTIRAKFVTFSITVGDLVRPLASVGIRAEGKTLRAGEVVAHSIHTVSEAAAVLSIADLEVTELMGAVVGWLSWLWKYRVLTSFVKFLTGVEPTVSFTLIDVIIS